MLSMLEEVVLLAVDEKTGDLRSAREFGTAYALVGAVFFDLALARKIDTCAEEIHIIDTTPTGDSTLDRILVEMARRPDRNSVRAWIEEIFLRRHDLEGEALGSLIARGILRHEVSKRLWIIDVERFPLRNDRPQQDVKERLAETIRGRGIPETRDIMLVSIAEQCGLLSCVLSDEELRKNRDRIERLCHLETISRKVRDAIQGLDAGMRQAMTKIV